MIAGGLAAGLLLLGLLGIGAAVLLRVETTNGTLVVEMNDDEVEARIKNGKLILSGPDGKVRYTLTPKDRSKKLEAGAYKIRVEGADGLVLDTLRVHPQERGRGQGPRDDGAERVGEEESRESRRGSQGSRSTCCPSAGLFVSTTK